MEFDDAFAWLVTWTTYGTWLPGDPRGNASPVLQADGTYENRINTPGVQWAAGNERTSKRARALQRFNTVRLDGEEAYAAAESIADAAASRQWRVLRGAVMPTHVHVLLQDAGGDGSAASRILKGVSQAALSERWGVSRRWWTRGGSERGLRGAAAVAAGVQYVAEQEGMLAEIIDNIPSRRVNPAGR